MVVNLFATIAELKHRLRLTNHDLDIVRIINLLSPRDWTFTFTFNHDVLTLSARTSPVSDAAVLIKGAITSVFNGQQLTIQSSRKIWRCDDPLNTIAPDSNLLTLNEIGVADSDDVRLDISCFSQNRLPISFSRRETIQGYLLSHTWVGSSALPKSRYNVVFQVLGTTHRFENHASIDGDLAVAVTDSVPTVNLERVLGTPSIGKATFKSYYGRKDLTFRWTYSGLINSPEKREWLELDKSDWAVGEVEITVPNAPIAPDGGFGIEGEVSQLPRLLKDFAASIGSHEKFQTYEKHCERYRKEQSARLIDKRKKELMNVDFVFYRDRLVYRVPSNEIELVALHQKLEGMGGLPLAAFSSLEYTSRLGIDAIVHYKVKATEALHRFATVEFEYHYESFFQHGHPVEQTNLIICWDRRPAAGVPQPVADIQYPWLSTLAMDGNTIRVIEVAKYPDLTIKKIGEESV